MVLCAALSLAGCSGESPEEDASGESGYTGAPAELSHDETDTPTPAWDQAIRRWEGDDSVVRAAVLRLFETDDESSARATFESWTPTIRRGFVVLVDRICNEGWLDSVGALVSIFDSALHFRARGDLASVLETKAREGRYIENTIANGAFAYLNKTNHKDWVRAWAESDREHAGFHVGVFADGHFEVHMELYNPMFVNGAPTLDLFWAPGFGWINRRLFFLHQKWEAGAQASNRRSANYWHFLHDDGFPLSF
jgi:hypothetical protein